MGKTILITGATDGIGLETARRMARDGHTLLLHGRSQAKLDPVVAETGGTGLLADLSRLEEVAKLAREVTATTGRLDVLINNAGVLKTPQSKAAGGLDVRFVVNLLAPMALTARLLPLIPKDGRIVNLSSAAQAPVGLAAMRGERQLGDMEAYSQSKLAITMWSMELAEALSAGPVVIPVNPGSLLASKMVREGFGVSGSDIGIGADILISAATAPEFASASGRYFDNDAGQFGTPHPDALDRDKRREVVAAAEALLD
ncbi:MAG: SDR family NAD(P)-dependent oxidoreductase [Pseudomonadota bacterium]